MPITALVAGISGAMSLVLVLVVAIVAARRKSGESWLLRAPLLWLVLAVVLGLIATYSLLLLFAFDAPDFKLPATANVTSPVLVAATLIAGALTAAYAVLRLRAHLLAEEKGRLDVRGDTRADGKHRSDLEAAFTERFAKAVELLATEHSISRIAGSHLILALGDEWSGGAQRCLDVLISHLRGLNEGQALETVASSRGVREEVRLITSEVLARLGKSDSAWKVRAGDLSGAALADLNLADVEPFQALDLRGARLLGDLIIPAGTSLAAPLLAGMICEGSVSLGWASSWEEVDMTEAAIAGSVTVGGDVLTGGLNALGLHVDGDLGLGFKEVHGDVTLDSAVIGGEVVVGGSLEQEAVFGLELDEATPSAPDKLKPATLSVAGASFQKFSIRRSPRGPRLDLTGATGAVDLTNSVFPAEVTASQLDASSGFYIRGARFKNALVLDGAQVPSAVDLEGFYLSPLARSAVESSEFALRDRLLDYGQEKPAAASVVSGEAFNWQQAIEPIRERIGDRFMRELEPRLTKIQGDLPLDWSSRPTFTARVMSEVSRAAARADAPASVETAVHDALRAGLGLATLEEATS